MAAILDCSQSDHQGYTSTCLRWFLETLYPYLSPYQISKTCQQVHDFMNWYPAITLPLKKPFSELSACGHTVPWNHSVSIQVYGCKFLGITDKLTFFTLTTYIIFALIIVSRGKMVHGGKMEHRVFWKNHARRGSIFKST